VRRRLVAVPVRNVARLADGEVLAEELLVGPARWTMPTWAWVTLAATAGAATLGVAYWAMSRG